MALKKSELYASLWAACDELRGGMDASQYKDYVLVLLFMKYVSDKARSQPRYLLDVPAGASFDDMVALKGDPNIGEKINTIIASLARANDLGGIIDVADFNDPEKLGSGKEMVDRLSNLVAIFDSPDLDFSSNRADGDDLLGDAYEYLMRHFATESGKSKGQFYTPAEVSRVMSQVIGLEAATSRTQSIYDPTCGSGSLLLKAHDAARDASGLDLAVYGQEMDVATTALARMNMILHDNPTAEIAPGGRSTLASPFFRGAEGLKTFDYVVANPPFSSKSWRIGFSPENDEFHRFVWGMPPPKNGDFAFLLHLVASMKTTGSGACILPHGVLFRGGSEGVIRRELVRRGYVKGVIGLPANLFYGTGIPACILVLDKEGAHSRTGVFLLDASKGFIKDGPKNRLREQDIHRIVDTFNALREVPNYSRLVPTAELEKNDWNLNLARYVDSREPEDLQEIEGHLRGGIPDTDLDALDSYWAAMPSLRGLLFERIRRGYSHLRPDIPAVRASVLGHPELAAIREEALTRFDRWWEACEGQLAALSSDDRPKFLGAGLANSLLSAFDGAPLLDAYAIYQRFMDYWSSLMQDDVYLVVDVGWEEAGRPRPVGGKDGADYVIGRQRYKSALVTASTMVERYFAAERAEIDDLDGQAESYAATLADLIAEHGGEEGALADVVTDDGKIDKKALLSQLKLATGSGSSIDELEVFRRAAETLAGEAGAKLAAREARKQLDTRLATRYGSMSVDELKALVLNDRWRTDLRRSVEGAVNEAIGLLVDRIETLAARYATPLGVLVQSAEASANRVRLHLERLEAVEA